MQVLLSAATPFEIAPAIQWLEEHFKKEEQTLFTKGELKVQVMITGVGMMSTAWALGQFLAAQKPGFAINAGVAGAIDRNLQLGDVVQVVSEQMADLGVEESDGSFSDLFALALIQPNEFPFQSGTLPNPYATQTSFLPNVSGITVNKVHGSKPSIDQLALDFPKAQVESMEGAAFFYACLQAHVPFVQIRSISNYVEPRNRNAWRIPEAIENLNQVLIRILREF
ncbi:MAG: futalosine hydrolase [Saprospiraceae bacterium]